MKVIVQCPAGPAAESRREQEEEVDVDMEDTIGDVKIKVTLVYTDLDPDHFVLVLQSRALADNEKIINLVRQKAGEGPLTFQIRLVGGCCGCSLI